MTSTELGYMVGKLAAMAIAFYAGYKWFNERETKVEVKK